MDDPPARGPRPVSTLGGLVVALGNKIGGGAVRAVIFAGTVGIVLVAVSLAFLALFIVHQLSLWLSVDPERAFSGAKTMVGVYATTWDTTANVYNSFADVVVAALPAYNAAVYYGVQPSVFTALDVLSLAFLQRPYGGIISEEQIPFEGYSCPPDGSLDKSAQWCGLLSFYSKSLGIAAGSTDSFVANSSIVLSTRTARRLSFAIGEPVIGVLDLEVLVDAIQAIVSSFVVLSGTLSDIIFHVAFTVLSEVFELLFSLFMLIVKSLASAVMMVIRSGVLQTVIKIGMDLLIVLVTEVALPLLMAVIDVVTCLLDLTQVAGWTQQLLCIERRCFQEGGDAFAEVMHTFSSIPVVAGVVQNVFAKLTNSGTGQRYGASSSGRNDLPNLDAGSAGTPRAATCGACFNCKACTCLQYTCLACKCRLQYMPAGA